jgi:small subunit ribosomal protein S18
MRRYKSFQRERGPGRASMDFCYRDVGQLRKFMSGQGKIHSRKRTGLNSIAQSKLKRAIKYARYMALLPYTGFGD